MKNMRKASVAALVMAAAVVVMMSAGESAAASRVGGKAGWARLRLVDPSSRRIGAGDVMARRAQALALAVRRAVEAMASRMPTGDDLPGALPQQRWMPVD
jgi:hypothetical protein